MASAPWDNDPIVGEAPPPRRPRPIPRTIQGPPREPPPQTGAQAEQDRLGVQLAQERLQREQAEARLREAQQPNALRAAQDPAGDAGVDQRRTAGFYLRALRANEGYSGHQVQPRGVIGQTLADAFPRAANALTDAERQQAEAYQRDFIGATLRYESGAAIPESELLTQARIYFPQPGDAPDTIALKAQLRQNAIEALQRSAGQAANGIEPVRRPGAIIPGAISRTVEQGGELLRGRIPEDVRNTPIPPNLVQPGEQLTRGSGLPPLTGGEADSQAGRNELGTSADTEATPEDRALANRRAAQLTAVVRSGRSVEEINRWLSGQGLDPLDSATAASIENFRRARRSRDFPHFIPRVIPTGAPTEADREMDERLGVRDSTGADTAFVAGALDSASLGLPGLVSEDYRNSMSDIREESPYASAAGSIAGAILAPGGPRPGMSLGTQSVRSGAQGAVYGFNSGGGDIENALVGGGIGLAAPGAFNLAGRAARGTYRGARNFLSRPGNYDDAEAQALARAFNEEGVPGSRPLLDPASRDRMAYLESLPGTGEAIRTPLQATRDALETRVGALGQGGTAEELGTMGQRVQEAGQRYIDRSRNVGRRMYDRAAQLAGDTPIQAREAVNEIDSQIAALRRNPNSNAGEINFLEGLRRDFVDENGNLIPKTVGDIRDLRTGLRGRVSENNLTFSQIEGRVLGILGRAAEDIERDLGGAASPANRAYRRADRFYAERQSEIRQVIQRVIGRRDDRLSGEQVMQRLRTMASNRGDADRLSRLWARLSPDERIDAAATIAETAGRRAGDEAFSPAQFLSWSRTLSPSARRTIFGPDGAQSIANLARISEALKATEGRLNNSRSGVVQNWRAAFRDFTRGGSGPLGALAGGGTSMLAGGNGVGGAVAGFALGAGASAVSSGIRRLSARSLMSPDLSRWLAGAARVSTPSAIRRHIDRLTLVARSNPAIAQEVTGLRQALLNAVNDNIPQAGRMAASPNEGPDNADQ